MRDKKELVYQTISSGMIQDIISFNSGTKKSEKMTKTQAKQNLTILLQYMSGLRINEVFNLTKNKVNDLIQNREIILDLSKSTKTIVRFGKIEKVQKIRTIKPMIDLLHYEELLPVLKNLHKLNFNSEPMDTKILSTGGKNRVAYKKAYLEIGLVQDDKFILSKKIDEDVLVKFGVNVDGVADFTKNIIAKDIDMDFIKSGLNPFHNTKEYLQAYSIESGVRVDNLDDKGSYKVFKVIYKITKDDTQLNNQIVAINKVLIMYSVQNNLFKVFKRTTKKYTCSVIDYRDFKANNKDTDLANALTSHDLRRNYIVHNINEIGIEKTSRKIKHSTLDMTNRYLNEFNIFVDKEVIKQDLKIVRKNYITPAIKEILINYKDSSTLDIQDISHKLNLDLTDGFAIIKIIDKFKSVAIKEKIKVFTKFKKEFESQFKAL